MTVDFTDDEREKVDEFLAGYFSDDEDLSLTDFTDDPDQESVDEADTIEALVEKTRNIYDTRGTGYLGLALAFVLSVEDLSKSHPWATEYHADLDWEDDIKPRYDIKGEDYQTGRNLDTLTLRHDGNQISLRSRINDLGDFFPQTMNRTNFPNAPGHYTGNWEDHIDILELSFELSSEGRREAAERLIDLGLTQLESKNYPRREPPFPQPFLEVLNDYDRKADDEPGGLTYQSLVYGYATTEWSHLSLRASRVRTGSSRQHRFGDVDGYHGPDLMVAIEAKDRVISESDIDTELGTMVKLAEESTALSVAVCKEVESDARDTLEDADVKVVTDQDLTVQLRTWDYHKQNDALHGMIHYLRHVEENPKAVQRLLRFVKSVDPENPALAHLEDDSDS